MRRALILAAALALSASAFAASPGGFTTFQGGPSPGVGFDAYAVALQLLHKEEYARAIPYLEAAQQQRPHNADILTYLGFAHRMAGDEYAVSIDYFEQAIAENPDNKNAHEYLGEVYLDLKLPDRARGQLAELTRICPTGCDERDTLTKSIAGYETKQ